MREIQFKKNNLFNYRAGFDASRKTLVKIFWMSLPPPFQKWCYVTDQNLVRRPAGLFTNCLPTIIARLWRMPEYVEGEKSSGLLRAIEKKKEIVGVLFADFNTCVYVHVCVFFHLLVAFGCTGTKLVLTFISM